MRALPGAMLRPFISFASFFLLAIAGQLPANTADVLASGVIVDSAGFEMPAYQPGELFGQNGWLRAGQGGGSAVVQADVALSGQQSVQVDRGPNSDDRWAVPVAGFPERRFVLVDWDMNVGATGNSAAFGPFFGVEAYDADTGFFVLGSLGVDATTGEVLYQAQDSGVLTAPGPTVPFDSWNHFQIVLDFATDEYWTFVNGELLASTGFVDRSQQLDDFTDADIAAIGASFDPVSQAVAGTAYFDNFVVRQGLAGDYNDDGTVDAMDYNFWKNAFGTAVNPGTSADGNANGIIGAADYTVWRDNSGSALFGAAFGSALPHAVPEPTTTVLSLSLATICLFFGVVRGRGRLRSFLPWP